MIYPPPAVHVIKTIVELNQSQTLTPTITVTLTCEFGAHEEELTLLDGAHVAISTSFDGRDARLMAEESTALTTDQLSQLSAGELELPLELKEVQPFPTGHGTSNWELSIRGKFPVRHQKHFQGDHEVIMISDTFDVSLDATLEVPEETIVKLHETTE